MWDSQIILSCLLLISKKCDSITRANTDSESDTSVIIFKSLILFPQHLTCGGHGCPILQMWQLKHRELKQFAQAHLAMRWRSRGWKLGSGTPDVCSPCPVLPPWKHAQSWLWLPLPCCPQDFIPSMPEPQHKCLYSQSRGDGSFTITIWTKTVRRCYAKNEPEWVLNT